MSVISRKIMKHYGKKIWSFIVYITTIMSSPSEFTTKVTMISDFCIMTFTKLTTTYMAHSRIIIHFNINFGENHLLGKLKLFINLFDILSKFVNKNLCNIIIFTFCNEYHWLLSINAIIKTFNIIAKRARSMFLIFISVGFTRIRLTRANWLNK